MENGKGAGLGGPQEPRAALCAGWHDKGWAGEVAGAVRTRQGKAMNAQMRGLDISPRKWGAP